jgi:hypothetical protein
MSYNVEVELRNWLMKITVEIEQPLDQASFQMLQKYLQEQADLWVEAYGVVDVPQPQPQPDPIWDLVDLAFQEAMEMM